MITLDQARQAKDKLLSLLASVPGFSGVGVSKDGEDFCVAVRFTSTPVAGTVPDEVDGVKVQVATVGNIVALSPSESDIR
jgi:hypothetical protein